METDEKVKDEQLLSNEAPPVEIPTEVPKQLDVVIVNLGTVMYEGKANTLIAPGPFGDFAILPGHTPLFIKLVKGAVKINNEHNTKEIQIEGGVAKITQVRVVILVGF